MRAREVDVLLIDQTEFLAWVTGFSISENMYRACLLPLEGDPVMLLRAVDLGPFLENSWLEPSQAVAFADWEDPIAVLARTVEKKGWSNARFGIDENSYNMPLRRFKQLQQALPGVRFNDFSDVLEQLRRRKSPQEIAYLRRASEIGDLSLAAILDEPLQGMSARRAAAIVHRVCMQQGADTSRAGIITTGEGNSFLHGNLHSQELTAGQILHMELLPMVKGYSARLMRPAVMGHDAEKIDAAKRLVEIQDKQFAAMRPGASARDVDAIARNAVLESGLRSDYLNITGYTIGYFPLSTPRTSDFTRVFLPNSDWALEEGMTFHMYVSANGLAFSETVLVTADGIELLTRSPRKLFTLGN